MAEFCSGLARPVSQAGLLWRFIESIAGSGISFRCLVLGVLGHLELYKAVCFSLSRCRSSSSSRQCSQFIHNILKLVSPAFVVAATEHTNQLFTAKLPLSGNMGKESSSGKSYAELRWYCHNCSDGPLSVRLDAYCPICDHLRCTECQTVKMTYSSHR
ncbi:hypothetical protein VTK26DRAFT_3357 [Humicola hyalothermophila]